MNQIEATKIVVEKVMAHKPGFSLMLHSTEEFGKCFAFYYQNDSYVDSGDVSDMSVGQGPIIVCKTTGECFETGSTFSTHEYVHAFEACGDPYGRPTARVRIIGWIEGANAVKAVQCVKAASNLDLAQAKLHIDTVLSGGNTVVYLDSIDEVAGVIQTLSKNGFESRQLWSNQC